MQIVSYFFDFLFPPRPQQKLVREVVKLPTRSSERYGSKYLCAFDDPIVRAVITENKYHHNHEAILLLASAVDEWLSLIEKRVVLIPIPLSKERLRARGYNQVTEVLKKLKSDAVIAEDVLSRIKNTESQTSLNKKQRRENLRDAFVIKNINALQELTNSTVVLVDDVITTGATMEAARAKLAPHLPPSCELKTLAFAH